jgi:hypothetical protein
MTKMRLRKYARAGCDESQPEPAAWCVSASREIPVVEFSREERYPDDGAIRLPGWTRATRPNRAGMFIPGLLMAIAVLAATGGVVSTVLELAWL